MKKSLNLLVDYKNPKADSRPTHRILFLRMLGKH